MQDRASGTLIFDYPTIAALADHLAGQVRPLVASELIAPKVVAPEPSTTVEGGIAVIGAGCRFPGGCDSLQSYWDLLSQGRAVSAPFRPTGGKTPNGTTPTPPRRGK